MWYTLRMRFWSAPGECRLSARHYAFLITLHQFHSALKSPQILELSGIGRREVLENAGISVNVELPGVGENLQEHYTGNFGFRTYMYI